MSTWFGFQLGVVEGTVTSISGVRISLHLTFACCSQEAIAGPERQGSDIMWRGQPPGARTP